MPINFNPYKDFTLNVTWSNERNVLVPQSLSQLSRDSGIKHMILAFINSQSDQACSLLGEGILIMRLPRLGGLNLFVNLSNKVAT